MALHLLQERRQASAHSISSSSPDALLFVPPAESSDAALVSDIDPSSSTTGFETDSFERGATTRALGDPGANEVLWAQATPTPSPAATAVPADIQQQIDIGSNPDSTPDQKTRALRDLGNKLAVELTEGLTAVQNSEEGTDLPDGLVNQLALRMAGPFETNGAFEAINEELEALGEDPFPVASTAEAVQNVAGLIEQAGENTVRDNTTVPTWEPSALPGETTPVETAPLETTPEETSADTPTDSTPATTPTEAAE